MQSIVIDVGHGWRKTAQGARFDPGAVSRGSGTAHIEHHIASEYGVALRDALKDYGYTGTVYLLRATESNPLTLSARRAFQPNASAFVSIHLNSHTDNTAHGFEVWYGKDASLALAQAVHGACKTALELHDRGIKRGNFTVLQRERPSVLVELGFMSNPRDLIHLILPTTRDRWAQTVARALVRYLTSR